MYYVEGYRENGRVKHFTIKRIGFIDEFTDCHVTAVLWPSILHHLIETHRKSLPMFLCENILYHTPLGLRRGINTQQTA